MNLTCCLTRVFVSQTSTKLDVYALFYVGMRPCPFLYDSSLLCLAGLISKAVRTIKQACKWMNKLYTNDLFSLLDWEDLRIKNKKDKN
jgi:hypothetical protein